MAKSKIRSASTPPIAAKPAVKVPWLAVLVAIVLAAYLVPLTSADASIQWDAVDVHYSAQRYFAERVLHGELPYWTPYIFSGFPFLADPQTGGWYPGNWPFLLAGPGPKSLEAELALHALIAAVGLYLLLRRWVGGSAAATGALCYALGGFFAGHSSHIGMFQSAALLPWLLFALILAVEGNFWLGTLLGTGVGGALILAGHFQTALYSFTALLLAALATVVETRGKTLKRAAGFVGIACIGALLLSAIQTLPGLERTSQSIRAATDTSASSEGVFSATALPTLLMPDYLGATSQSYHGPGDVTQYYFYSGFLLLPLGVFGLRNRQARNLAIWLGVPALLYITGPGLGFYRLVTWIPGFRQIRAPIHAWFVVGFALAILAAAGAEWMTARWKWAATTILPVFAASLSYTNVWNNPLAYAHASFESLYGRRMELLRRIVVPAVPALTRFDAPDQLPSLGPMNDPLDVKLETTYGYNPLKLAYYSQFQEKMAENPKLRDSLSVSRVLDTRTGALVDNPSRLPRAYFPKEPLTAATDAESIRSLSTLDPPRQSVLMESLPSIRQDQEATATLEPDGEQAYRIKYRAATESVLRVSIPFFPGWQATVDGRSCRILRADHAMTAVVVPAGGKELVLRFQSNYFAIGAALSGAGVLLLGGLGALAWRTHG